MFGEECRHKPMIEENMDGLVELKCCSINAIQFDQQKKPERKCIYLHLIAEETINMI